ncbi:MAG: prepilin-type N-terminal cleavage/methylation domain-containing protein [bacterium]|nr:prepilin-type N-terminal cleavage/methylation domain-containing protein [bacterium]
MRTAKQYSPQRDVTRTAAGVTLLELLVVLMVIAMLSTMIVPNVARTLRGEGIATTGEKVCDVLNFAYMSAVTRRQPAVVHVDTERHRCWVTLSRTPLPWMDEQPEETNRVLTIMELPEDVEVSLERETEMVSRSVPMQAWDSIVFASDGRTDNVSIAVMNQREERYEIRILGATGEVHGEEIRE